MRYKIVYSDEALSDLNGIGNYIAYITRDKEFSIMFVDEIKEEINTLKEFPHRYKLVDTEPWHSRKLHRMIIHSYVILYAIDEKEKIVNISRIHSTRQNAYYA